MGTRHGILRQLADGHFHSGTDLGARLGVSRAAVCKAVQGLTAIGLEVQSVPGRGYRLERPLEPLTRATLLRELGPLARRVRDRLTILDEVDSTNRYLLAEAMVGVSRFHGAVCLAESQPRGRGRRGRQWITTPYHNVMLSMGWRFTCGPGGLSGLSLAAGLAVLCALERYGVGELSLKWPNDILCRGRKLGGLLLDLQGEASGPSDVVFGLGVNGYLAAADARRIDQPWIDLAAVTGRPVARNRLVALILRELFETIERFADKGFAAFRDEWHRRHAHQGAAVCVIQDEQRFNGVADGVDEHGALRLRDSRGQVRVFHSGDVSLRAPGRPA